MQETQAQSLDGADALEKGMATHSRTLDWRIPRTEGMGGPQSMGSQEPDMTEQLTLSHSWTHTIDSLFILPSFNLYYAFNVLPFHGLTAYFFLLLSNILLSGCATVYLFSHLLKDILVASKFWQL